VLLVLLILALALAGGWPLGPGALAARVIRLR
jgi:hypothetical protein